METILALLILFVLFELFEIQWQKAPTMLAMLARMYQRYRQNIFAFFLLHPTYFFAIWLIVYTHSDLPAMLMLFTKTVDIATKIVLMQQVFEKREVSTQLHEMLIAPMQSWMPYVGLAFYPVLVVWALR